MPFRIEAFQNRYLPPGEARVDAIVTIAAAGDRGGAPTWKDVRVRLWTPQGARVVLVKEVHPATRELTGEGRSLSAQVREYMTHEWRAGEARDFHVSIEVRAGAPSDELLACRPSVVFLEATDGAWHEKEVSSPEGRLFVTWTGDVALTSRVDARCAAKLSPRS